jgi:hypothetical protein
MMEMEQQPSGEGNSNALHTVHRCSENQRQPPQLEDYTREIIVNMVCINKTRTPAKTCTTYKTSSPKKQRSQMYLSVIISMRMAYF